MSLQPFESFAFSVNGIFIRSGSVDPTISGVDDPAGSLYLRSNGALYVKGGAGANNWGLSTTTVPPVFTSVSANYTALVSDNHILFDRNGAARTLTLFTAVGNAEKELNVTVTDNSRFVLTIQPNGAEKISGFSNLQIVARYTTITLKSDGTNWMIV